MARQIKTFRDFLGLPKIEDFRSFEKFKKSPALTWILLVLFAVLTTMISTLSFQRIPKGMEEGMIAAHDIKADRNYEILDEETTNKLRQEAFDTVLPVYNFDEGVAKKLAKRVRTAFSEARQTGRTTRKEKTKEEFTKTLGIDLPQDLFDALLSENFSQRTEQAIGSILLSRLSEPVVAEKSMLLSQTTIVLRQMRPEGDQIIIAGENTVSNPSQIISTDDVRQKIAKMTFAKEKFKNPKTIATILAIASEIIEPNVSFDSEETSKRQLEAASGVQDVILKVKAGEMIIRNGARFEPRHIKILNAIRSENKKSTYGAEFMGTIIFVLLWAIVVYYFAERYIRRFHPSRRAYILMGSLALVQIALTRIGFLVVPILHDALFSGIPLKALYFAIPVAGSSMLLRMFLSAEDSLIFAVFAGLLMVLFYEVDVSFASFCFAVSIAGITAIANADKRSSIIKAGLVTGAYAAVFVFGIKLIGIATAQTKSTLPDIFWHLFSAFAGGSLGSILVLIASPVIESVSNYVSDIKLLELANLNHPLLRELIVRAPGTYHHSHMIGILAEAAAEAIGANPLLVRVGAYYHDIGKMKKPPYFIENAKEGENRHAKLTPKMSALIVSSHIKEGVEMGAQERLPKCIIDMIREHHGTRAISFFYEKAIAEQTEADSPINEADFHYPGPKPQTREAAILMLADICEAKARSLKEKGASRIEETVRTVINNCFAEEQLDECELTLRDLNEIAMAFTRILLGIYHQRIEYPKEGTVSEN